MINYSLKEIAEIVGGTLVGNGEVKVSSPLQFDSRIIKEGGLYVPIIGERVDGHSFVADLFTKGIAGSFWQSNTTVKMPQGNLVVVDDVVKALQILAIHRRKEMTCRFVGVTGSSGKTSTKDIVAAVISAKYRTYKTLGNQNNDIGVPLTILNMDETVDYAVCEMGINDFGVMDRLVSMVQPDITVITSINHAHEEALKSIDNIVAQKCQINRDLGNGQCFYNLDTYGLDNYLNNEMPLTNKPVSYGFTGGDYKAENYILNDEGTSFDCLGRTYSLPVLGQHQVLNALASIAIGKYIGMSEEEIQKGLSSVVLTAHRLQLIHVGEALVIDDAYNSNPGSLVASLDMVCQYNKNYTKTVVLGDMLELGVNSAELHASVADQVDFHNFDNIYLLGTEMLALHNRLTELNIVSTVVENNQHAAELLKKHLEKNNVIFFKASNGMHFTEIINILKGE